MRDAKRGKCLGKSRQFHTREAQADTGEECIGRICGSVRTI